ncbi:MAG: DUF6602 domain-containing protein [Candidatus Electronema sp. VV]
MSEIRSHIGVDSFFAEREKLLAGYAIAKKQTSDDAVKTEHGNTAEFLARRWLQSFLPKRFGVCKGYIITPCVYIKERELEEWDIIIYDAIESPILFTRGTDSELRQAIPIEHVRAVIEVKAALTPDAAKRSADKLLKLERYMGNNDNDFYPEFICNPFVCAALFFETNVKELKEYQKALTQLSQLYRKNLPFMGSLVLKSQAEPDHSGYLQMFEDNGFISADNPLRKEMSIFSAEDGKQMLFGTFGYCANHYPMFLFDLLAFMRGTFRKGKVSSTYGIDLKNTKVSLLFPIKK